MASPPTLTEPETVSANLRMILRGLLAALGAWRMEPVLAMVLYRRVGRTLGQIERMLMRFRAGRLWRMPPRVVVARPPMRRAGAAALPRRFGWLVQLGGHHAAGFGLQLQTVLNTPDMAELLASSTQAGRLLRPLCRALAVELPGQHATATTQCATPTRRKSLPRAELESFRIPLPRGVLSAARKAGVGKCR